MIHRNQFTRALQHGGLAGELALVSHSARSARTGRWRELVLKPITFDELGRVRDWMFRRDLRCDAGKDKRSVGEVQCAFGRGLVAFGWIERDSHPVIYNNLAVRTDDSTA